jgi:hypothetical protein
VCSTYEEYFSFIGAGVVAEINAVRGPCSWWLWISPRLHASGESLRGGGRTDTDGRERNAA